ncbi:MAG: DNA-binding protein [Micrococcales bacterium]|nr:DNA-binding protein [Micrococcales bacterium]
MVNHFLTLADVADVLNISADQAYSLVRSGELRAIKVGGRGQWRIGENDLEDYIQRMYAQTEESIKTPDQTTDV